MNNFIVLEEISQTQFSTILSCKNKTTRDKVVLKQIRQKNRRCPKQRSSSRNFNNDEFCPSAYSQI